MGAFGLASKSAFATEKAKNQPKDQRAVSKTKSNFPLVQFSQPPFH
jgi:hypothetical protein